MTESRSWGRAVRRFLRALAAAALCGAAASGWAADLDLVTTVSTNKAAYEANEVAQVTVRVLNRGPAPTANTRLLVQLTRAQANQTWTGATQPACTASAFATCPTSYQQVDAAAPNAPNASGSAVLATIPALGVRSEVTITLPVRLTGNYYNSVIPITATVTPQSSDNELIPATNESRVEVRVTDTAANYGLTLGAPQLQADGSSLYDVTLVNRGVTANSLRLNMALTTANGTASANPAGPFTPAPQLLTTDCVSGTGGASCANVRALNAQGNVIDGSPAPDKQGVVDMPPGSSLTFRARVSAAAATCSESNPLGVRTLTLTGNVLSLVGFGTSEASSLNADNTASQITNSPAPTCRYGDLAVQVAETPAQQAHGIDPTGTFSYTVTASNSSTSPDPATNARMRMAFYWPTGNPQFAQTTCTASGGAVCPASYQVTTVAAAPPLSTQVITVPSYIDAVIPSLPQGGAVVFTVSGTSGADTTTICKPLNARLRADLTPPADYRDTAYTAEPNNPPIGAPFRSNNAYIVQDQANIGSACGQSYDFGTTKEGPYRSTADMAAGVVATNVQPGEWLYYRETFTNAAGSKPLLVYGLNDQLTQAIQTGAPSTTPYLTNAYDYPSQTAAILFRARPGEAPGLPVQASAGAAKQFDSGVVCSATGGAVCPDYLVPSSYLGQMQGWTAGWNGALPAWPAGGTLTMVSRLKVPALKESVGTTCVPASLQSAANVTLTNTAGADTTVTIVTDPLGTDRGVLPNSAKVTHAMNVPVCNTNLTVTKTLQPPATANSIPADGVVKYTVTVGNPSTTALDLPRLIDYLDTNLTGFGPRSARCVGSTGGGQCPNFDLPLNQRRLADGTLQAYTAADALAPNNLRPMLDFVWGSSGAATMPAGSTVTFEVEVGLPQGTTGIRNTAVFQSASAGWPSVSTGVLIFVDGSSLPVLQKRLVGSALLYAGGSIATYEIDVLNLAGTPISGLRLSDALPPDFVAANPQGFTQASCRPVTAADGVGAISAAAACPAITSDATGIATPAFSLPAGSGLRFTVTAKVPDANGVRSTLNQAVLTGGPIPLNSYVNLGRLAPGEPAAPESGKTPAATGATTPVPALTPVGLVVMALLVAAGAAPRRRRSLLKR